MEEPVERVLAPWTNAALNDITWTELHSGRGTAGVGKSFFRRHYPSLKRPGTFWLELNSVSSGWFRKRVQSSLKSTQDVVTVDTTLSLWGSIRQRILRVNQGPAHHFQVQDRDWVLLDERDNLIARFERGATSEQFPLDANSLAYLGGPDDPHVYEKVYVGDEAVGEMIVPNGGTTFARFKHQPLAPYLRNVPEDATPTQVEVLLMMLLLPIIY